MGVSIVQYYGEQTSKCGYCTGINCSKSHGMHAYCLDCQDYQDLIDRGWRRCGNYCYKPQNESTCCPCYTIKCDTLEFKLTRSNKRILRRMNRFLRDGKRETNEHGEEEETDAGNDVSRNNSEPQPQLPDKKPVAIDVEQIATLAQAQQQDVIVSKETTIVKPVEKTNSSLTSLKSVASSSNPPRKKAKQMRLERRQAKLGINPNEQQQHPKTVSQEKSLRDFMNSSSDTDKHKLKLRLVNVHGEEFKRTLTQSYALYQKYQITIHNDPPKNRQAYQDHLQVSPLKHQKHSDGPDMGYGSFHQQYWLDDKLIAVGVIDILPGSVSSVYFFYDPDYSFLSLGTYGSLREIDLVQSIAAQVPALKYYYMGFYIHSCPKMRYKGKLSASYLLCPETYVWLLLTDAIRSKLDEHKYQRLNTNDAAQDENEFLDEHLDEVRLLLNPQNCMTYRRYVMLTRSEGERDVIIEYGKLVGNVCALRMLYVNMS